eukprot:7697482-Karenia_brevis.AAC.1
MWPMRRSVMDMVSNSCSVDGNRPWYGCKTCRSCVDVTPTALRRSHAYPSHDMPRPVPPCWARYLSV